MEQRAFFHLAALKVTPPMATCGSGSKNLFSYLPFGPVWSG